MHSRIDRRSCLLAACSAALAAATAWSGIHPDAARASGARDVAVVGIGDSAGYHLLVGTRAGGRVAWREVAVVDPGRLRDRTWTGNACVTADGRHVGVVVLPGGAVNTPSQVTRGAFGYTVDLASGRARLVTSAASMSYDNPGCGDDDRVVFRSQVDEQGSATRLIIARAGHPARRSVRVSGQVTSAVPAAGAIVAARGSRVVRIQHGRVDALARTDGTSFEIRPQGAGRLTWLSTQFGVPTSSIWGWRDGRAVRLGRGDRVATSLIGTGRHVAAVGAHVPGLHRARHSGELSTRGTFVAAAPRTAGRAPAATTIAGRRLEVVLRPASGRLITTGRSSGEARAHLASAQTPTCSVPRLDPRRQVMQPNSVMVDWATQMAARGLLTAGNSRPDNFANMGLPAYAANDDFPRIALSHPGGDSWDTVPRSVMEAVMAQESNWDQASFHALPGIAGGPLISDYYGTGGNSIDHIDFSDTDCGYGIAQVTDGMRAGQSDPALQAKIAVDYGENIAAGLRILEAKWNQLYAKGIVANGGNPRYLENWYFALWAYNTGLQPSAAFGNTTGCEPGPSCVGRDGTWGLGWLNNPNNPAYPPNRSNFLQTSYDDARHPADWPYQERVLGWMGSPLQGFGTGDRYDTPDYHGSSVWLHVPPAYLFCAPADNRCSGANQFHPGTCQLASDECWWHAPVSWVTCATSCATSDYSVPAGRSEPGNDDPHEPTCNLIVGDLPERGIAPPIVVDDLPSPGLNLRGCPNASWTTDGSFTYHPGQDGAGDPVGEIDTHQLGAGFGGHILFTHTEQPGNHALINTGIWAPNLPSTQTYSVAVHVPSTGADTTHATYTVDPNGGSAVQRVTISQATGQEAWLHLGRFRLSPGATVALTNTASDGDGTVDIAFDAIAFVPQGDLNPPSGGGGGGAGGGSGGSSSAPSGNSDGGLPVPDIPSTGPLPLTLIVTPTGQTMPKAGTATIMARIARGQVLGVGGQRVTFRITSGPNSPVVKTATTNNAGFATVAYDDRNGAGRDSITVSANVESKALNASASVTWARPVDCNNRAGAALVVAVRCAAARPLVQNVLKGASCVYGAVSTVFLPLKVIEFVKAAKSIGALNALNATDRPTGRLLYDLYHADYNANARPGFRSFSEVVDTIGGVQSAADFVRLLPDLFASLKAVDANQIALDIADISGLKPCVELVSMAID